MIEIRVVLTVCAVALLAGCSKPEGESSSAQSRCSVQVVPILGGRAMIYQITDHQKNKLYTYGSGSKDSGIALIQTIDLASAGQKTLIVEAPKQVERKPEN
jgi:hypothetical protein